MCSAVVVQHHSSDYYYLQYYDCVDNFDNCYKIVYLVDAIN